MKKCITCNSLKEETSHYFRIRKNSSGKIVLRNQCIICSNQQQKKYTINHPKTIEQKENFIKYKKSWRKQNKDKINQQYNEKLKTDPIFKLRKNISRSILDMLFSQQSSKRGYSILQYLPYTLIQLQQHLQNQFDDKMTWQNHGSYWHLDHIIPQSDLPYSSMLDENFQKTWALNNLRPLEAKQNMSDGATKIRHKNFTKK